MKPLKPMIRYFGSKYRNTPYYPEPQYSTIIEPFAGGAGYSLHYWNRQIILNDLDPGVASMWRWLISADPLEILDLPVKFYDLDAECPNLIPEARLFIKHWLNVGTPGGKRFKFHIKQTGGCWGSSMRLRTASQLKYIRHWRVTNLSYEELDNQEATWFIDPPYQHIGGYRYKTIDFNHLAQWCQSRYGQVMVCEQQGADWLPFEYLGEFAGTGGIGGRPKTSIEVLWTNTLVPTP